ncbi:MAG: NAD(P)-dependent alcohol dehydrogenase [Prolixibacteraceae bacterium]|nr:NAD(P)-dependent alcohol dehydrogenase [Prolixibacteraceae bacterium]
MKAIVYQKRGTPEKLILKEVEKPVPGDHEILVKIHATSLNAADYRSMQMGLIPKRKIFGADVAGIVEAVGPKVTLFNDGDAVMGDLSNAGFGGLAQYVTADEKVFVHKPENISFDAAAALPLAGLTALVGLRDRGKLQKGEEFLLVGSAGGVGTYALQLAKFFGARVTAVCSTHNVEQTLKLGADEVIDYNTTDFTTLPGCYDLVLAVNGNRSLRSYYKMLKPGGRYVMVGGSFRQIFQALLLGWLYSFGSRKMTALSFKPLRDDLRFLAQLMHEGYLQAVIEKHYPLDETVAAFKYLRQGHARGKVVIHLPHE